MHCTFQVTQEDINAGCVQDEKACPVSRGLQRKLGTDDVRVIGAGNIVIRGKRVLHVPTRLKNWIHAFDGVKGYDKRLVVPTSFTIDVPV
jgi:hypothetical protein